MRDLQLIKQDNPIAIAEGQHLGAGTLESFIKYIDVTPKTVETYTRALKQLFMYFNLNGITAPQREDIIAYRETLKATGHKPSTIQSYITAAKLFFKWTSQSGIYPNIADHLKGAKLGKEHRKDYLTPGQVKDVLENIDQATLKGKRDYAIFWIMTTGGLRTIEVVRANIEDFRPIGNNTVIYVQGKGRTERTEYVKIPPPAEKALRAYLQARGETEETSPLFTSISNHNRNERMTTRSISRVIKERLLEAGYNSPRLTAHSLRHTAVNLSAIGGRPLEEVQQFARHKSIVTTMVYFQALDKAKNSCSDTVAQAILKA